jgi:hypothetical protein
VAQEGIGNAYWYNDVFGHESPDRDGAVGEQGASDSQRASDDQQASDEQGTSDQGPGFWERNRRTREAGRRTGNLMVVWMKKLLRPIYTVGERTVLAMDAISRESVRQGMRIGARRQGDD